MGESCKGCRYYDCRTTTGSVKDGDKYSRDGLNLFPVHLHECHALPEKVRRRTERAITYTIERRSWLTSVWRIEQVAPTPPRQCSLFKWAGRCDD